MRSPINKVMKHRCYIKSGITRDDYDHISFSKTKKARCVFYMESEVVKITLDGKDFVVAGNFDIENTADVQVDYRIIFKGSTYRIATRHPVRTTSGHTSHIKAIVVDDDREPLTV